MRPDLEISLREIKKYYFSSTSREFLYKKDIQKEFKEWIDDSFQGEGNIWSLPDLTKMERFENFCRSIRKKIN